MVFKKEKGENQQARRKSMNINKNDTAVVVIDPQNDILSEKGVSWDLVGESVKDNNKYFINE
ncbi:hypothetical protein CDG77_20740 [Nostoc sp. 'Peltigera membranacea cyanobiont' 213]|nr:hypothetical protein CDG77_20740 [Nostoc sp. 'Peltigera membranacea cyanobiont' 213]